MFLYGWFGYVMVMIAAVHPIDRSSPWALLGVQNTLISSPSMENYNLSECVFIL